MRSARRTPRAQRTLAVLACAIALGCAGARAPSREVAGATRPPAAASKPWSVVLITVDALRADRMSLYGNARPTTPRLDAFAREAAVFENFFAVAAHTSPGIVSLLTGQAPAVHAQTTQYSYYDALIPSPLRALAARGYDVVGFAVRGPTYEGLGFTRGQDGKPTEQLLGELAQSAKPFFAWLHTRETHLPYKPAPELSGKFTRGLSLDSPLLRAVREYTFVLRNPPAKLAYRHAGSVAAQPGDAEPLRALYDECVASADARVGGWLERLRELGLLERTIVVITADHGDELLDHGWVGHASTGYDGKLTDEILHVPLIVRIPGGAHAGRYGALASQVDLMPTLFELLGIDGGELAANQQGVSLAPVLRGEQQEVREFVSAETTPKGWTTPRDETRVRVMAIRTRDRKLIVDDRSSRSPDAISPSLFDLSRDPAEHSLAAPSGTASDESLTHEWQAELLRERTAAERIATAAAGAHLALLDAASARGDVIAAVAQWQAIRRLHETWGLERTPFYAADGLGGAHPEEWRALQLRAADRAAQAIRCAARDAPLAAPDCSLAP